MRFIERRVRAWASIPSSRYKAGAAALAHAIARWRRTHALPWLVAALAAVPARAAELSAAAERVPKGSLAELTLLYHRVRLLLAGAAAAKQRARALLDEVLVDGAQPSGQRSNPLYRFDPELLAYLEAGLFIHAQELPPEPVDREGQILVLSRAAQLNACLSTGIDVTNLISPCSSGCSFVAEEGCGYERPFIRLVLRTTAKRSSRSATS